MIIQDLALITLYSCADKISSISKGAESVFYEYDGKFITLETFHGTLAESIAYTWNNDFNLTGTTYAGVTTAYTYDDDSLLTGAGNFTVTRNALNDFVETVSDGTLIASMGYNGYGEKESHTDTISGQAQNNWSLTRDDTGKITGKTHMVNGVLSNYTYGYDAMGRLLTVTKDGVLSEEYQYNTTGTRVYEMNQARGITGRTLSYTNEDHLLTAGSITYEYSPDGFLKQKADGTDITQYAYSSRGELLRVALPDTTLIEYVHDPQGRRIAKKVNGTITEKYLWQGLTRLLAVYDGTGNLKMRFEYASSRMPVSVDVSGARYYFCYDQVGSLILVTDISGAIVKQVGYDTFGNILTDSNPAFEIPLGFAGGLLDYHTGLVRFGYRDYDPEVGRWTAKDPIFFDGGDTDLYGYVLNDPINLIDPNGLSGLKPGLGGYTLERYSTYYSRMMGNVTRNLFGETLKELGVPTASSYIGSIFGGVGYVLLSPSELANGELPDKDVNGIPDLMEHSVFDEDAEISSEPCK